MNPSFYPLDRHLKLEQQNFDIQHDKQSPHTRRARFKKKYTV
jgi:hypothetical protein